MSEINMEDKQKNKDKNSKKPKKSEKQITDYCLIQGCMQKAKFPYRLCENHLQESSGRVLRHHTDYSNFRSRERCKVR